MRRAISWIAAVGAVAAIGATGLLRHGGNDAPATTGADAEPEDAQPPASPSGPLQRLTAPDAGPGAALEILRPGDASARPRETDAVRVHQTVWGPGGRKVSSTRASGRPATLYVKNAGSPDMTEALQQLGVGGRARLWLPRDRARILLPDEKPDTPLVVDLTLVEVLPTPTPPPDLQSPGPGFVAAANGLRYRVLKASHDPRMPGRDAYVALNFIGWRMDGTRLEGNLLAGAPTHLALRDVIRGWREGIPLMHVGETVRFWIPAELAYGDPTADGGAADASAHDDHAHDDPVADRLGPLVYDIELVDILTEPPPPADYKTPPATAEKTESGARYLTLVKSTDSRVPRKGDTLELKYSAWTRSGHLFHGTSDGETERVPFDKVAKSWQECLSHLHPGEKMRIWVPKEELQDESLPAVVEVQLEGIR